MGSNIALTAADGHSLRGWRAGTDDAPMGLVVLQEIFGVNAHIRSRCEAFAEAGFAVVAPALFDRVEAGIELGYTPDDVQTGIKLRAQVPDAGAMADIDAAAQALSEALGGRPLGVVGYCWGGTLAWWGATRATRFRAAVGWYGGGIAATRDETPHCPVQLHFGEEDHGIKLTDVEAIRAAQPDVEVYVYPGAGHGFGCDARASYSAPDAELAQSRTLAFLRRHLPG